jgi:DNA-binding NtrC family response regulator
MARILLSLQSMKERHTVLVVEDDAELRATVVTMLEDEGLQTISACDGEAALGALHRHPVEAVLTDIQMPRKNGLELLVEAHELYPDLKVIVMAGFGSPEEIDGAIRAGAFHLIWKPFDRSEVLEVLSRALES